MDKIELIKKEGITIEILLTEQCNFRCGHCMYDSGPNKPSKYISDDILSQIEKQVKFLKALNIKVKVNLIGGEPTLNLSKFEKVLKRVCSWNPQGVSISTNGWWLKSERTANEFIKIVSPYINKDRKSHFWDESPWGFLIRISTDNFHEAFFSKKELEEKFNKLIINKQMCSDSDPWIFIQKYYADTYYISPNGRGAEHTNINKLLNVENKSKCLRDLGKVENIHYLPSGEISDTCGLGSVYPFGTAEDNIIYVMMLINEYKTDRYINRDLQPYNCLNCKGMVNNWVKNNLEFYKNLYNSLNVFDTEIFLEAMKNI